MQKTQKDDNFMSSIKDIRKEESSLKGTGKESTWRVSSWTILTMHLEMSTKEEEEECNEGW